MPIGIDSLRHAPLVLALVFSMTSAGCSCSANTGGGSRDAGGSDAGGSDANGSDASGNDAHGDGADAPADGAAADADDGTRTDAGGPTDAARDAGFTFPPYPMRCPDEAIPGFKPLDGGWFRACNCFDGDPLRPVPTQTDDGLRTIPFDCAWPVGTIWQRGYLSTQPAEINFQACEYIWDTVVGPGFVAAPFTDVFWSHREYRPAGIARDRICVPTECVFDTPGEPARCSEDCAPFDYEWMRYYTIYRVDRSACGADAGR